MVVNNYLAIKNDNVFVKIVFNSIFHENADLHNNYYRYLVRFGLLFEKDCIAILTFIFMNFDFMKLETAKTVTKLFIH